NRAKARGSYIIIGHCRPHTAAAFRDIVPQLQAQGIEFVYVSSLLRW
ncbi:MAG: divergent polysaccharide deacetylase family protein, partial [Dialister invisus]|nr:divergent polysaccharide deacetylase family protein [Dialister invisus]